MEDFNLTNDFYFWNPLNHLKAEEITNNLKGLCSC